MKQEKDTVSKLKEMIKNSQAKYSNFKVSSIIIDKNKNKYFGVNFESSSFGATVCAERTALGNAFTNGVKKDEIMEIHVMAKNKNESDFFVTPCGICRQLLIDYANKDAVVFSYNYKTEKVIKYKLSDLLPYSFSEEVF